MEIDSNYCSYLALLFVKKYRKTILFREIFNELNLLLLITSYLQLPQLLTLSSLSTEFHHILQTDSIELRVLRAKFNHLANTKQQQLFQIKNIRSLAEQKQIENIEYHETSFSFHLIRKQIKPTIFNFTSFRSHLKQCFLLPQKQSSQNSKKFKTTKSQQPNQTHSSAGFVVKEKTEKMNMQRIMKFWEQNKVPVLKIDQGGFLYKK